MGKHNAKEEVRIPIGLFISERQLQYSVDVGAIETWQRAACLFLSQENRLARKQGPARCSPGI